MRIRIKYVLISVLFCFISKLGLAKHIYGGDFNMTAIGNNRYQITLNLYFDEIQATFEDYERTIPVKVFRKSDNAYIATFNLVQKSTNPIIYDNKACAELRQLKTREIKYSVNVILASKTYNDPAGYFMVWERCCRNNAVTNIKDAGSTGMAFLLEFPALLQNNAVFKNSSPDFSLPNGDYICINKPFQFDMGAKDADGDELRYSLVDPIAGFTTQTNPLSNNNVGSWPYPPIVWMEGFSANVAIKGTKNLSVNPKTGMLTVTASETGLFAFAVLIEEYRNGVRLGSVRREFQLPVVDCSKSTPPSPTIYKDDRLITPLKTVEICEGNSVDLFVKNDPNWSYQWQKDGFNLPNETLNVLKAKQAGNYQVIVSFAKTCANDTISQVAKVLYAKAPVAKITPSDTLKVCKGDSATLSSALSPSYIYEWRFNGTTIRNQTKNNLKVNQEGDYELIVRQNGIKCVTKDTVYFGKVALPNAELTATKTTFCPDDSIKLQAKINPEEKIDWFYNNQMIDNKATFYEAKAGGNYRIRVYNGRCEAFSKPITVKQFAVPKIKLDSLLTVCYDSKTIIPLDVTPTGGKFIGKGVQKNNSLSISDMGVGTFDVKYVISTSDGCSVTAHKKVIVKPSPKLALPTQITVPRGESKVLKPTIDSTTYNFHWEPSLYLSDAQTMSPVCTPPISSDYVLTVTGHNGCVVSANTKVYVHEGLFIPDVFTPNGDGINDTWEIKNIEIYPNTEVLIFNRWGEQIFYQKSYKKPWDGTYQGNAIAEGIYVYLINTHIGGESSILRGKVVLSR